MPAKASLTDAKKGLKTENKSEIFPGYNGNDEDYIDIDPENEACGDVLTVEYNTNFAIVATDASTVTEVIGLAKGVIPKISSVKPSVNTIINGIEALNKGINDVLGDEEAAGTHEFKIRVTPCSKKESEETEVKSKCFLVTFLVIGTSYVQDADPNDPDELAHMTLTLSVREKPVIRKRVHDKRRKTPVAFAESVSVGPIKADKPFNVYAKADFFCQTDGPGTIGGDSVSLIKVDYVKIIVESVDCPAKKD